MIGSFFVPLVSLSIIVAIILIAFKFPNIWKGKFYGNVKWLMIGYIGLLLFVTFIYFSFIQSNVVSKEMDVNIPTLHEYISGEQVKELPAEYMVSERTVPLEENEITIALEDGMYDQGDWIPVIIEEEKNDGLEAEVKVYETPSAFNGMDITSKIKLATVQVDGSNVIVTKRDDYVDLQYYSIQNEQTVTQFTVGVYDTMYRLDVDLKIGEQMIYISLPENAKVNVANENSFDVIYK